MICNKTFNLNNLAKLDALLAKREHRRKNCELLYESKKPWRRKRLLTRSFARTAHNRVFYARATSETRSNAKARYNID